MVLRAVPSAGASIDNPIADLVKMRCVNATTHQWRTIIVADIVGHADTTPAAYTAAQSLACY